MSEKPILFSGPMVRAILEGRKTQTRRVMSFQPDEEYTTVYGPEMYTQTLIDRNGEEQPGDEVFGVYGYDWSLKCPYGKPGDYLWVRETWQAKNLSGLWWHEVKREERSLHNWAWTNPVFPAYDEQPTRWMPSIFMPREACRILLKVVNVRVERLQLISEEDARAEGVVWQRDFGNGLETREARPVFFDVWDAINYNRNQGAYTVSKNPWVWVIEFKRMEGVDARS